MRPVRLQTAPTGPGENIELPIYFLKFHTVCATKESGIGVFLLGYFCGFQRTSQNTPFEKFADYIFKSRTIAGLKHVFLVNMTEV